MSVIGVDPALHLLMILADLDTISILQNFQLVAVLDLEITNVPNGLSQIGELVGGIC